MQPNGGQSPPRSPSWSNNNPLSKRLSTGNYLRTAAVGVGGATGGTAGNNGGSSAGAYYSASSRPNSRPSSTYGTIGGNSGPSTGLQGQGRGNGVDEELYRTKVNKLIQNFFMKAAMIIIQSRMPVPLLYDSRTNERRVNKWVGSGGDNFNIELDDTDAFREELTPWKTCDAFLPQLPPLIIETYIDANDLTSNQTLVILDENGKRWNVDAAMNSAIHTSSAIRRTARLSYPKPDVILERWIIELRPQSNSVLSMELPAVYKLGIVFFRSLFAYTGLMPAQRLWKRLAKVKMQNSTLKVMCRVVTADAPTPQSDGLEIPLIDGEDPVIDSFSFGKVETPAGEVHVKVDYRKNAEFRVDDNEELLSSHFVNMDEQNFEPSLKMHSHQRTFSQPQFPAYRDQVPSDPAPNTSLRDLGYPHGTYNQTSGVSAVPSTFARSGHVVAPSMSESPNELGNINLRSVQGSKSSLRSVDSVGIQRRPSISFHPFKSPSLSASPASDVLASSPRTSVTRLSTAATTAPVAARSRPGLSSTTQRSSLPQESPNPGTSDSSRPGSVRYSSSFGQRKLRPMTATSKVDDDNSSGIGSCSSSFAAPISSFFPQSGSGTLEDDDLASFLKLVEEKPSLHIFSPAESSRRTASTLSKYQQMRESHNALSESLTTSLILQRSGSLGRPGASLHSLPPGPSHSPPSSSSGRPTTTFASHTPVVPSRLSEGLTAEYEHGHRRAYSLHAQVPQSRDSEQSPDDRRDGNDRRTGPTSSPLSIPRSPRPFSDAIRRPNSYSQHHHPAFFGHADDYEQPLDLPASSSLGSRETVPLSIRQLAELRDASEENLLGRESAQGPSYLTSQGLSEQRSEERPPRSGYESILSSNRGRFASQVRYSPGASTLALDSERAGSSPINERMTFHNRRTHSGGYDDDEVDVFAMSDVKLDQDKSGSGEGGKGSETLNSVRKPRGAGNNW